MSDTLIQDVSDTAFWVAYYRAKESSRPDALFNDPFAQQLVGERGKKISDAMPEISRYTEWSVISRTVIIDRFIQKLISEDIDAVINLGAGLDARPYRMDLPQKLIWIEADYPAMIEHKEKVLAAEKPKCKLSRVGVDLADASKRGEFLAQAAPTCKKVLVLTEGVIPYLSPDQVSELAADLVAQARIKYWIAEYFDPKVYRHLKKAVRVRAMKNAPFLFFPPEWYEFFAARGWMERETHFTGEIAKEFGRKIPMPRFAELIFDLLPKRMREQAMRYTGYVLFRRSA